MEVRILGDFLSKAIDKSLMQLFYFEETMAPLEWEV